MNAEKLEQPVAGWCAGCDSATDLEYDDGGTLVCAQCVGPAAREAAAKSAQPSPEGKTVFACSARVLLLARWRVIAQECDDVKSWVDEKEDPAMHSRLAARSQTMREAADDLEKHTGAGQ